MQVTSINFETWLNRESHSEKHKGRNERWHREVYPWDVFQRLNYDDSQKGVKQDIRVGGESYEVTVQDIAASKNNTIKYILHLKSTPKSKKKSWVQREWDQIFWLIFKKDGEFVTLYAYLNSGEQEPSALLIEHFFNSRFSAIKSVRSLSLSSLLFRSLVSYIAYDSYKGIERYKSFDDYEPFLSKREDLWVNCRFTEKKAHRLGTEVANKAEQHIVVYCHPTLSKHHRCDHTNVRIVSLSEFLNLQSSSIFRKYIQQVRFLINHLNADGLDHNQYGSPKLISLEEIAAQKQAMEINTSYLREAKSGLGIIVNSKEELAYICACANLLNAALDRKLKAYKGSQRLNQEMYFFKQVFARSLNPVFLSPIPDTEIYVDEQEKFTYIKVLGLQFSYKNLPESQMVKEYEQSPVNKYQEFSRIYLKPKAPLVLDWARQQLMSSTI